jgi:hypothetical protein
LAGDKGCSLLSRSLQRYKERKTPGKHHQNRFKDLLKPPPAVANRVENSCQNGCWQIKIDGFRLAKDEKKVEKAPDYTVYCVN